MPMTLGAALGHRRIREFFEISADKCLKISLKKTRAARANQEQPHRIVLLHHLTMLQLLPGHAHVSMFCRWHCDRCDRRPGCRRGRNGDGGARPPAGQLENGLHLATSASLCTTMQGAIVLVSGSRCQRCSHI